MRRPLRDFLRRARCVTLSGSCAPERWKTGRVSIQSDEYAQFRRQRRAYATGPTGPLALVETTWLAPGETSIPERADLDHGGLQRGYRVWDDAAPTRAAFEDIDAYDFDESWVLSGRFELVAEERLVPFEHIADGGRLRQHGAAGDVVFSHEGVEYRLAAFDADDDDSVQLVFADTTNGSETYGTGRFLWVDLPPQWRDLRPGESVPVEVDFNRSVIPPCGFSMWFNCPLPPLSNRLPFPIRAGEKNVRFASGFDLYA